MRVHQVPGFEAIAVQFEICREDGRGFDRVWVPLAEAQSYHDDQFHSGGAWVQAIRFRRDDGTEFESFGKSWVYRGTSRIARIGSGAYGDGTVVEFAEDPRPSATLLTYRMQVRRAPIGGAL